MKMRAVDYLKLLPQARSAVERARVGLAPRTAALMTADVSFAGFFATVIDHGDVHVCALDVTDENCRSEYSLLLPVAGTVAEHANPAGPLTVGADGSAAMVLPGWDVVIETHAPGRQPMRRQTGPLTHGVPFNPTLPGNWHGLELVPRFMDLCEGVALSPDWLLAPNILAQVSVPGGYLFADPADHTFTRTWTWQTSDGHTHEHPATDTVRFRSYPAASITLRLTSRSSGAEFSYALTPDAYGLVPIWFLAWPPMDNPDSEDRNAEIDAAHYEATLRLCSITGTLVWHRPALKTIPNHFRPDGAPRESGVWAVGTVQTRRLGRPNCGARILE